MLFHSRKAFLCSMSFISLRLNLKPPYEANADIVSGILAAYPFSGFEFSQNQVISYLPASEEGPWLAEALEETKPWTDGPPLRHEIADRNWNEEWEKHYYQPLLLAGKLWIRGSFHPHAPDTAMIEITVDPKMSFGTGHHPTTALVAEQLLELPLEHKIICDMGCGTGILAILAEKLGAARIMAIDYDPLCVENTTENLALNNTECISVLQGEANVLSNYTQQFDVFIANIQKSIIMRDVNAYRDAMKPEALLLVSGFFSPDLEEVKACFALSGLHFMEARERESWCYAVFQKP